jgi:hypothetical protein
MSDNDHRHGNYASYGEVFFILMVLMFCIGHPTAALFCLVLWVLNS